ncbi:hypothetical protein B7494_g6766 [Chlorociboria aeruginascens]|nr:hypothetical protein B7494_g6766 [Chlorociboria aeruginascens]
MALALLFPLRIAQGVFAVIVLGLSASSTIPPLLDDQDEGHTDRPTINFLLFAPIFSLFSILYLELAPRFFARASHPYAHFALAAANAVFYFAGFVALSVFLAHLIMCRGSVCAAARADAVFGSFNFLLWIGTTLLLVSDIAKGGTRGIKADGQPKMTEKLNHSAV